MPAELPIGALRRYTRGEETRSAWTQVGVARLEPHRIQLEFFVVPAGDAPLIVRDEAGVLRGEWDRDQNVHYRARRKHRGGETVVRQIIGRAFRREYGYSLRLNYYPVGADVEVYLKPVPEAPDAPAPDAPASAAPDAPFDPEELEDPLLPTPEELEAPFEEPLESADD